MELHSLRVTVTEQDFNDIVRNHLLREITIDEFRIAISSAGVQVSGVYQVFVPVSFEALWEPRIEAGKVVARMTNFKTLGMPGNILKSLIMNVIADAAKKEPWLSVKGDEVIVEVEKAAAHHGVNGQFNLKSVICADKWLEVTAGPP